MLHFLSSNYSGLVIAFTVAILGFGVFRLGRRLGSPLALAVKLVGVIMLIIAFILSVAAGYHLVRLKQAQAKYPAPGQLVDIGRYKLHILAQGPVNDEPTIVWIPGRHDQGLLMHHLHKEMAKTRRSVLFDRPGTGWSDTGPFPRTVTLEANELHTLLEKSGETGPYILVPWSFSGLLSTTFAALYPQQTAGLVLLDTTDPAGPVFDRDTAIKSMCKTETKQAWLARYGWGWDRAARLPAAQLDYFKALYKPIADVQDAILANNAQPRYHHTACSALRSSALSIYNSVQGDGGLGDLPIFVIIPEDYDRQADNTAKHFFKTPFEQSNAERAGRNGKNRLARLSSRAEIRNAPPGSTHSFPFESPQYVIEQVNEMVALTRPPEPTKNKPNEETD